LRDNQEAIIETYKSLAQQIQEVEVEAKAAEVITSSEYCYQKEFDKKIQMM